MFMGDFSHTIDQKGRLIIPSKFRDELGEKFVLALGLDGCVYAYPMGEWDKLEQKLRSLPLNNKNARNIVRFLVSFASTCELDKQGRVMIPETLRKRAGLEKEVVLAGNIGRIEIWDKAKWEESTDFSDVDSMEADLAECGIMI